MTEGDKGAEKAFVFFADDLLHSRIVNFSLRLFEQEHYKQAAAEAMTQVEQAIKERGAYPQKLSGQRLAERAFGVKGGITLEVGVTGDIQEQAKQFFKGAFAFYRNYAVHEGDGIDRVFCARILVVASSLLQLVDASTIPFKGEATVQELVDAGEFRDSAQFLALLEFLDGHVLPEHVVDGFYEELYESGFVDGQLDWVFNLGLVRYEVTHGVTDPSDRFSECIEIGSYELSRLGEECRRELRTQARTT